MAAPTKNIKTWLVAAISWLSDQLRRKYPLWLYLVVFLACALFAGVVSCQHDKYTTRVIVSRMDYEGHSYLVFFHGTQFDSPIEAVHDPDCICWYLDSISD